MALRAGDNRAAVTAIGLCPTTGELAGDGGHARVGLVTSHDRVVICVDDTGPGIPEDRLAEAIRPFARLDASRTDRRPGTGLGLSIVHDIAQVLGARLDLRNRSPGLSASLTFSHAPDARHIGDTNRV